MITKKNKSGYCWWCNSVANSREHRYKKTDIIREFGKGPYKGETAEIIRAFNKSKDGLRVQGPNSQDLKFSNTICQNCNTTRSSLFDRAYDKFISYFKNNEDEIYKQKQIDFELIFGDDWEYQKELFIKYIIKHICSRLVESELEIKEDVIKFLDNRGTLTSINIYLIIREDKAHFSQLMKKDGETNGYLSLSPLSGKVNKENNSFEYIWGSYDYRGLSIYYIYSDLFSEFNYNFKDKVSTLESYVNEKYEELKKSKEKGL